MKKIIVLILALALVLGLCGCSQKKEAEPAGADAFKAEESEPVVPSRTAAPGNPAENEIPVITLTETGEVLESQSAEEIPGEPATAAAEASETPLPGLYFGVGMSRRGADGVTELVLDADGADSGRNMSLILNEDGTAILRLDGYDWPTVWDESGIYNEYESPGKMRYSDGHLSFGWEGGDGYYIYEFEYLSEYESAESGRDFFDVLDEEPYFIYSETGKHYGYEMDYWDGCSVWCAVTGYEVSASASSVLAPQGNYSYSPSNLIDGDRGDAWVEGVRGYGVGEYVEIRRNYIVADEDYGVDFNELCIVNGYAKSKDAWTANSRVKELKFSFNGEYVDTFLLKDTIEPQYFDLTPYQLHAGSGENSVWRFEIVSVYPGDKYDDTVITGIEVDFWTPNH